VFRSSACPPQLQRPSSNTGTSCRDRPQIQAHPAETVRSYSLILQGQLLVAAHLLGFACQVQFSLCQPILKGSSALACRMPIGVQSWIVWHQPWTVNATGRSLAVNACVPATNLCGKWVRMSLASSIQRLNLLHPVPAPKSFFAVKPNDGLTFFIFWSYFFKWQLQLWIYHPAESHLQTTWNPNPPKSTQDPNPPKIHENPPKIHENRPKRTKR
jgi:hypothetical protein